MGECNRKSIEMCRLNKPDRPMVYLVMMVVKIRCSCAGVIVFTLNTNEIFKLIFWLQYHVKRGREQLNKLIELCLQNYSYFSFCFVSSIELELQNESDNEMFHSCKFLVSILYERQIQRTDAESILL